MISQPALEFLELLREHLVGGEESTQLNKGANDTPIATARREFKTFAAWIAPCSVNAQGNLRLPPRPDFDIAICDIKGASSGARTRSRKSEGKRSMFRLTASLRRPVLTP